MSPSQEKPMQTWYNQSPEVQTLKNTMRTDEIEISKQIQQGKHYHILKAVFVPTYDAFLIVLNHSYL